MWFLDPKIVEKVDKSFMTIISSEVFVKYMKKWLEKINSNYDKTEYSKNVPYMTFQENVIFGRHLHKGLGLGCAPVRFSCIVVMYLLMSEAYLEWKHKFWKLIFGCHTLTHCIDFWKYMPCYFLQQCTTGGS